MSGGRGAAVQRAIDFLSGPDAAKLDPARLPAQPDYEALVQRGSELGYDLSADGLRAAFALIIRARLLAELHTGNGTKR